jgi:predicted RNA-binding protein with PIN domain
MRLLIDGYNLMHAQGLTGPRQDPDRLRKAREKLLKSLSKRLSAVDRHATRVVFDASMKLQVLPKMLWVDGITVEFASDSPSADVRIVELILKHDAPKKLVVVSSDNQIIECAQRRKCRVIGADDFMVLLEDPRRPVLPPIDNQGNKRPPTLGRTEGIQQEGIVPKETDFWMEEFSNLIEDESVASQLNHDHKLLRSVDIAAIEREMQNVDPFEKATRKPPQKKK